LFAAIFEAHTNPRHFLEHLLLEPWNQKTVLTLFRHHHIIKKTFHQRRRDMKTLVLALLVCSMCFMMGAAAPSESLAGGYWYGGPVYPGWGYGFYSLGAPGMMEYNYTRWQRRPATRGSWGDLGSAGNYYYGAGYWWCL